MANISWNQKELHQRDNSGTADSTKKDLRGGLQQGYELGSLTDGLVAYYPFDGDVKDYALNNDGEDNTSAGYIDGRVGDKAKEFDGIDDAIYINDKSVLGNLGSSSEDDFTYSMWIKTSGGSGTRFISDRISGTSGNRRCELGLNNDGTVDYNWGSFEGSTVVNDGNWHQIILVSRNGNLYGYVDGSIDGNGARPSNVSNTEIYVGAHLNDDGSLSGYFPGQIDDLRIYDHALSLPEIKALYQRTSTQKITDQDRLTTGLVGHWPLNEDAAGTAYDLSGRGKDSNSTTGTTTTIGIGGTNARSFDGSDDTMELMSSVYLSKGTMSYFVKIRNFNSGWPLVGNGGTGEQSRTASNTDGTISYQRQSNSNSSTVSSTTSLDPEVWYHVVATWDDLANEISIHVNGSKENTNTSPGLPQSGDGWRIARQTRDESSNTFSPIEVADVRIYNRILSQSEIKNLAALGGINTQ